MSLDRMNEVVLLSLTVCLMVYAILSFLPLIVHGQVLSNLALNEFGPSLLMLIVHPNIYVISPIRQCR